MKVFILLSVLVLFGCVDAGKKCRAKKKELENQVLLLQKIVEENGLDLAFERLEGLQHFWPLNRKYKGRNMVNTATDLSVLQVSYDDVEVSKMWKSPPARFYKAVGSYADILDNDAIVQKESFSFLASVYRVAVGDGPIFEWDDGKGWATHIWIWQNKFYVNVVFNTCRYQSMFFNKPVENNKWYTLGISFDAATKKIIMTVNGESVTKQAAYCTSDLKTARNAHINRRLNNHTHRINGYITCVSVYEKAHSYDDMYKAVMPACK